MANLTDTDRAYIPLFVAAAGEALEEYPGAISSVQVLFDACARAAGEPFMPIGTFTRLLTATGYRRCRRPRKGIADLRPKRSTHIRKSVGDRRKETL